MKDYNSALHQNEKSSRWLAVGIVLAVVLSVGVGFLLYWHHKAQAQKPQQAKPPAAKQTQLQKVLSAASKHNAADKYSFYTALAKPTAHEHKTSPVTPSSTPLIDKAKTTETTETTKAAEPPANTTPDTTPRTTPSSTHHSAQKQYWLQIAVLSKQAGADRLLKQLRALGLTPKMERITLRARATHPKKTAYRMLAGPYPSEKAANSARASIQKRLHLNAIVVTH